MLTNCFLKLKNDNETKKRLDYRLKSIVRGIKMQKSILFYRILHRTELSRTVMYSGVFRVQFCQLSSNLKLKTVLINPWNDTVRAVLMNHGKTVYFLVWVKCVQFKTS